MWTREGKAEMKPRVFIFATLLPGADPRATTLVFKTLAIGFPTADIHLWWNQQGKNPLNLLDKAIKDGAGDNHVFWMGPWGEGTRGHDAWLEERIMQEQQPFWSLDTDLVFFGDVEKASKSATRVTSTFAGEFQPAFYDPFMGLEHASRLHTTVMYVNPVGLRAAMREWAGRYPKPWGKTVQVPFIRQTVIPRFAMFFDTMAGAFQAEMGTVMPKGVLSCYEHLNCGTWAHLAAQSKELRDLPKVHQAIFERPELAAGLRARQEEWYAGQSGNRKFTFDMLVRDLAALELHAGQSRKNGSLPRCTGRKAET